MGRFYYFNNGYESKFGVGRQDSTMEVAPCLRVDEHSTWDWDYFMRNAEDDVPEELLEWCSLNSDQNPYEAYDWDEAWNEWRDAGENTGEYRFCVSADLPELLKHLEAEAQHFGVEIPDIILKGDWDGDAVWEAVSEIESQAWPKQEQEKESGEDYSKRCAIEERICKFETAMELYAAMRTSDDGCARGRFEC